jgi:hypothetical protein
VDEVIGKAAGQFVFCGIVEGIRGANVLLLFVIIAGKWAFELLVVHIVVFVLWWWCVFAGGDMRNDLAEIDDELGVDDWTMGRFWRSWLSIGSDLRLCVSIDVVLCNCWYCGNKSSFVTAALSSNWSALSRKEKDLKNLTKMKIQINLAGLIDNGLNGTVIGVGESDCSFKGCSKDGRGILFVGSGLGWDVTIRCCKRDFRGCLSVVRRSANRSCDGLDSFMEDVISKGPFVRTSDIDFSASTVSSKAFIDNLTSAAFDSIIGECRSIHLSCNASICTLFSDGEGGNIGFLGDTDGILKKKTFY